MKINYIIICMVFLCGACSIGPDYKRPDIELPDTWRIATSDPGPMIGDNWWHLFNDPVLNALVEEALIHNQDMAMAIAQVDAARASLGMARSDQLPSVSLNSGFARTSPSPNSVSYSSLSDRELDQWVFNGLLSFELDLWGKYRRASEAAKANLLASAAARDVVRLRLISDVVNNYFALRALDMQVAIAEATLKSRNESEELVRILFNEGAGDELDYRQAMAETKATEAALRQYQNMQAATENALAVLLGKSPRDIVQKQVDRGQEIDKIWLPVDVPSGLALHLLGRRPDIWQAEQELVAANANIGVARAALFPSISLTGLLGYESVAFNQLFNRASSTWAFGGSLSMPLLNLSVWYAMDVAEANQRYALANYIKVLQTAYAETQSALINNRKMREVLEARLSQVEAMRRSLELATLLYSNGYSDYLQVLVAQRGLFEAEIDLAGDYQNQLIAVSNLCRTLGGGWQEPGNESSDADADADAESTSAPASTVED